MWKWAQMLILFNRCRSVDYGNASSGSVSVSSELLQIVRKKLYVLSFQMFCFYTWCFFRLGLLQHTNSFQTPCRYKLSENCTETCCVSICKDTSAFIVFLKLQSGIKQPPGLSDVAAAFQTHGLCWLGVTFKTILTLLRCFLCLVYDMLSWATFPFKSIMPHFHEVIKADHKRNRETSPTRSTRAILSSLWLPWQLIRHWKA